MTVELIVTEFCSSVGIMWLVCSKVTWKFGLKLGNRASVTPCSQNPDAGCRKRSHTQAPASTACRLPWGTVRFLGFLSTLQTCFSWATVLLLGHLTALSLSGCIRVS